MMHLVTYNDYVCYDMRSYFSKQPGEMTACPMCRSDLVKSDIEPSQHIADYWSDSSSGLIPWYDFSHLLVCPTCHWWYIRESWDICEVLQEYDKIATGVVRRWDLSSKKTAFAMLKEALDQKQKSFPHKILNAETVREIIAKYSRSEHQAREVRLVSTSQDATDNPGDVYLLEDNIAWLILVRRTPNGNVAAVDAIDILNGVLIESGRPSEMIVTSTNLLAKKAVNPWREDDDLLQYRKVYRVPFADERISRELLERTAGARQPEPWQTALKDTDLFRPSLLLPKLYGEQFGSR